MNIARMPDIAAYARMTTEELRRTFLIQKLFVPGSVSMTWCDADRAVVGGAVPLPGKPLRLEASAREMAASFFAERRETGVVNIGAEGTITTDGTAHRLGTKDMLYIGRGVKEIAFEAGKGARYYFVSFPAHAAHPTVPAPAARAERNAIGSADGASARTINKYIHPRGVRSCQLVMGLTDLAQGSVWNTMPPHTHLRRMEVYLYFGIDGDNAVVHLMGTPEETRSLIVRDGEAVISPPWSIHCGAGTSSYSFVWAMGGENQDFADMDPAPIARLS